MAVDTCDFYFAYRDALKRQYNLRQYYLEVNMEDLASFDEELADKLTKLPSEHLPLVRLWSTLIKL